MIDLPAGLRLVLASASPRRSELLSSVGLVFEVVPAEIDETAGTGEDPAAYVARLSRQKADAVVDRVGPGVIVVAADTTVDVDGMILEKPTDEADARRMLTSLSARTHLVHTGVTIRLRSGAGSERTSSAEIVVETAVEFTALTPEVVEWYIGTGEPFGKAGGYALQGAGGALVRRVDGSVTNVIGLPLVETLQGIATALTTA
jgi:septum formation protein